jgi:hypothetical protein
VLVAAYSALRSPPDTALLLYGDTGAQMWAAQAFGPLQLAWLLALPPAALAAGVLATGGGPIAALLLAGGWALASSAAAFALLRRWLARRR